PARRPACHINLAHQLGKRILVQIELGHTQHSATILGDQKLIVFRFPVPTVDDYGDAVITGPVGAGSDGPDNDLYVGWNVIERAHLALDPTSHVGRSGLGYTTQTNQKQNEQRTS